MGCAYLPQTDDLDPLGSAAHLLRWSSGRRYWCRASGITQMSQPTPPPPRLLKLSEVMHLTGLSKSTIYRRIAEGSFPKPVQISAHGVRWRESDIHKWIMDRPEKTASGAACVRSTGLPKRSRSSQQAARQSAVKLSAHLVGWQASEIYKWTMARPERTASHPT